MTLNELSAIIDMAKEHAERLADDVRLASTRMEHVRVTARANEAATILKALEILTGETDATNAEDNRS